MTSGREVARALRAAYLALHRQTNACFSRDGVTADQFVLLAALAETNGVLHDTRTPVPEQAAFRIDFPEWLSTLTARERRIIAEMARNERTKDLSRRFQLSPGRISQLRREFHDAWRQFVGGDDVQAGVVTA